MYSIIFITIVLLPSSFPVFNCQGISENTIKEKTENVTLMPNLKTNRTVYKNPVPYAKYLKTNKERQTLAQVIREARIQGASRSDVVNRIDMFLKAHLDAGQLKEIQQIRSEGELLNRGL